MKHRFLFFPSLLVFFCSCHLLDSRRPSLWLYEAPIDESRIPDSLLTPASFLEMRPDGSYTRDFGRYEYGSWALKNEQLYLTNQHHITYVYRVQRMEGKDLRLVMASGMDAHFKGYALPSHQLENDPFSTYNNHWRQTAAHKETGEEIRKRLFEHCHYWETYFTWAVNGNIPTIDVRQAPTPLKIYGNGFGLKKYADLPLEWKSFFFDEEDCHRADSLIKRTFRRNKIDWPETDDDNKKFISGFQQLEKFLK
jgi:hypothetical protein